MDAKKFDSRIYCCSNTARAEAKILAIVDVILNLVSLLMAIWVTDIVKNHPEYLRNITRSPDGSFSDLKFLAEQDNVHTQDFYLAGLLIWPAWGMILGGTFFYAAQLRKRRLLKVWFVITVIGLLLGIYFFILKMVVTQNRISSGVVFIMIYLYNWYKLWIAYRLIQELRSGSNASTNTKGEEVPNPALVVCSPTPDPDSVYTIEGQAHKDAVKEKGDAKNIRNEATLVYPMNGKSEPS